MRSELVFTHYTCNQNCTYCGTRRTTDDPAFIRSASVLRRVDEALARGATEIVLSGGEPAMRRDLEVLLSRAVEQGAESVVLESNATLIDEARARSWAEAGLTSVRVNLAGWGEGLDRVTRDPGGFRRTVEGIRAALAAGLSVELVAALVRSTEALVTELPERVAEAFGEASAGISKLLVRVPVEAPDGDELLSYERAARAIVALEASARKVGMVAKLAPDSGPPPCVFEQPSRVAHMYSLTPGATLRSGHRHLEVCDECQMSDRCSGLPDSYLERFAAPEMKPIREDRVRRRLSLISTVEEQARREFVQANRYTDRETGAPIVEHLIRVNFHCNQACRFCFVSTHLPPAGDRAVREAIMNACREGAQVTLTGGEPTLNANLLEYIRLAKRHSSHPVSLQTNCVRLADAELADAVVEAGVEAVQVSLHGTSAELSDAMTSAPGTFAKTILGIDHLHRHVGVYISINFVITQRNYADLVPFVRLVGQRWPRAFCNLSFVGPSSDVVPKDRGMVPRYSDVLPHLSEAIAEAGRLGVDIGGFESMCGVPLCLVPAVDRWFVMSDIPEGYDGGEFVRPDVCSSCVLNRKCFGVRRGYHELYGADELVAVEQAPGAERV